MRIFGRESAAWVALITIIVQAVGAFWVNFTPTVQAWVIAAVAAGLNLAVAFVVRDGQIAAITGFVQAAISLAVGLGANLSAQQQFYVMAAVTALAQFYARQQVTPPVPASDQSLLTRIRARRVAPPSTPAAA